MYIRPILSSRWPDIQDRKTIWMRRDNQLRVELIDEPGAGIIWQECLLNCIAQSLSFLAMGFIATFSCRHIMYFNHIYLAPLSESAPLLYSPFCFRVFHFLYSTQVKIASYVQLCEFGLFRRMWQYKNLQQNISNLNAAVCRSPMPWSSGAAGSGCARLVKHWENNQHPLYQKVKDGKWHALVNWCIKAFNKILPHSFMITFLSG